MTIIVIMLITAYAGYFMKNLGYSFITFIIGFILGPKLELALQQMLVISDNGVLILVTKPISAVFMALSVFILVRALIKGVRKAKVR